MIPVYAIGCAGNDQIGLNILDEMNNAGINTVGVQKCADASTMYSVCFQYPDRTGGNITTSNSACELVSAESVSIFFSDFGNDFGNDYNNDYNNCLTGKGITINTAKHV